MKNNKGFTLIELLVVIAIIGILSSIVIASLNSARTKGAVTAVKGGLAQVRAQAENWYDTNGNTYGTSTSATIAVNGTSITGSAGFVNDPIVTAQLKQIATQAGGTTTINTSADGQKWAIGTTLKNSVTYCIDNSGNNKESSTASAGACS